MTFATFTRCLAIGAASGLRTTAGIAALGPKGIGGWALRALEAGELVGDKLPQTPSRLQPAQLAARGVFGALAAGIVARREGANVVLGGLAGVGGAIGAAYAGAAYRGWVARKKLPDTLYALAEDALAVGAANLVARASRA